MLLPIHIVAGSLAIILGALALIAKKGGTLHRRVGLWFVWSMLTLGATGALLGMRKSLTDPNVFGGIVTIYFAGTALTTVRREAFWTRITNIAAMLLAAFLAGVNFINGVKAFNTPHRSLNGVPFPMLFFMGTVLALAAFGDLRIMRFGPPRGGARLARHLWRMCFALFIAVGSFFSIRRRVATILPEPFTSLPMRMLPIFLVFAAMFYWLWKVRSIRSLPIVAGQGTLASTAGRDQ